MDKKLNCLAITGGMGSGKSTVLDLFKQKGFTVISLDKLAHELLKSSSNHYQSYSKEIDSWLGTNYQNQKEINRDEFREIIKKTSDGFNILGKIAHPYLVESMFEEYDKYILNHNDNNIVFEVPLLVESGMHNIFSETLVVVCDLEVRINRILDRDPHLNRQDIIQRINIQLPDKDKEKIATYIINNSGSKEELEKCFNEFYNIYNHLKNTKKSFIVK